MLFNITNNLSWDVGKAVGREWRGSLGCQTQMRGTGEEVGMVIVCLWKDLLEGTFPYLEGVQPDS